MEAVGIELTTYRMRSDRSTTELCPLYATNKKFLYTHITNSDQVNLYFNDSSYKIKFVVLLLISLNGVSLLKRITRKQSKDYKEEKNY